MSFIRKYYTDIDVFLDIFIPFFSKYLFLIRNTLNLTTIDYNNI